LGLQEAFGEPESVAVLTLRNGAQTTLPSAFLVPSDLVRMILGQRLDEALNDEEGGVTVAERVRMG